MKYSTMRKVLIGSIGVDSGQLMIVDPCYLSEFKSEGELVWNMPEGGNANKDCVPTGAFSYSGACNATISEAGHGLLSYGKPDPEEFEPTPFTAGEGSAAVSETMYGDGCYPVYALYEAGETRPRALLVDMGFSDSDELVVDVD